MKDEYNERLKLKELGYQCVTMKPIKENDEVCMIRVSFPEVGKIRVGFTNVRETLIFNTTQLFNKLYECEQVLLSDKVVILPCQVGDKVYMVKDDEIHEFKVKAISIIRQDVIIDFGFFSVTGENFYGIEKICYLTREEAEKELAKLKGDRL